MSALDETRDRPGAEVPAVPAAGAPRRGAALRRRISTLAIQITIVVVALAAWEYLPRVDWLSEHVRVLDPYFISSPSQTWSTLLDLFLSRNGTPGIWEYLVSTVVASLAGLVIGTVLGAATGLLLSNSQRLNAIFRPFLVAGNAVPRIALIPIIVIVLGPTIQSSILSCVLVVFFVVFFNAYEGGLTVPPHVVQNARVLGASPRQLMYRVRSRYVLAWTVAALPTAVTFSLVAVVTTEILTGSIGLGRLLLDSVTTLRAPLTFAVVVVLSVLGMALVGVTEIARRRWLHWWTEEH